MSWRLNLFCVQITVALILWSYSVETGAVLSPPFNQERNSGQTHVGPGSQAAKDGEAASKVTMNGILRDGGGKQTESAADGNAATMATSGSGPELEQDAQATLKDREAQDQHPHQNGQGQHQQQDEVAAAAAREAGADEKVATLQDQAEVSEPDTAGESPLVNKVQTISKPVVERVETTQEPLVGDSDTKDVPLVGTPDTKSTHQLGKPKTTDAPPLVEAETKEDHQAAKRKGSPGVPEVQQMAAHGSPVDPLADQMAALISDSVDQQKRVQPDPEPFSRPCFPSEAPQFQPDTGGAAIPGHTRGPAMKQGDQHQERPAGDRAESGDSREQKQAEPAGEPEEPVKLAPKDAPNGASLGTPDDAGAHTATPQTPTAEGTTQPTVPPGDDQGQHKPDPVPPPPTEEEEAKRDEQAASLQGKQDAAAVEAAVEEAGKAVVMATGEDGGEKQPAGGADSSGVSGTLQRGTEADQGVGDAVTEKPQTDDSTKPPEEAMKPPEVEEEMPSFDEWKQKMLAEQVKQKIAQTGEMPGSPAAPKQKPVKKNRPNTASHSCGAKVLAANPEAQNPATILTENRDQYLINPCKVKKWFIVELCEPVQIEHIEIANFELFSSTPETFVVQVSDRYPAKEWTALGTFHARDERTVQSFSVDREEIYAKYIKVEMLTHYGQEHYCPLSIVRVYGTSVEEEWDEQAAAPVEEEATPQEEEEVPSSLFSEAKNTVMNMMKSVLTPGDQQGNKNVTADNGTEPWNATKEDNGPPQWKPVPPIPRSGEGQTEPDQEKQRGPALPSTPDALVQQPKPGVKQKARGRTNHLVQLVEAPARPLRSLLADCLLCEAEAESVTTPVNHTVCDYYQRMTNHCFTCDQNLLTKRHKVHSKREEAEQADMPSGQGKEEVVKDIQPTKVVEATEDGRTLQHSTALEPSMSEPVARDRGVTETHSLHTTPADSVIVETVLSTPGADKPSIGVTPTPIVHVPPTAQTRSHRPNFILVESRSDHQVEPTAVIQTPVSSPSALPSHNVSDLQQVKDGGDSDLREVKDKVAEAEKDGEVAPSKMGPKVPDLRLPTVGEGREGLVPSEVGDVGVDQAGPHAGGDASRVPTVTHQNQAAAGDGKQQGGKGVAAGTEPAGNGHQGNGMKEPGSNGNGMDKHVYPNSPDASDKGLKELEMEFPPPGDEPPGVKLSARKETAYMRLNNRIKALELNLTISSSYLEQLSKRYKRQMEDMYTSLNKTITKLTNMSKQAEERDARQQEHIASLHRHIENLTASMQQLYITMDTMQRQAIERHLCLMAIEALVFTLVLSYCLKKQRPLRYPGAPQVAGHQYRSRSRSEVRQRQRSRSLGRQRSSSSICIGQSSDGEQVTRLSGSESSLFIVQPRSPAKLFTDVRDCESEHEVGPARRRRRKNKLGGSVSTTNLPGHAPRAVKSGTTISSAGLLFAGNKQRGAEGKSKRGTSTSQQGQLGPHTGPRPPASTTRPPSSASIRSERTTPSQKYTTLKRNISQTAVGGPSTTVQHKRTPSLPVISSSKGKLSSPGLSNGVNGHIPVNGKAPWSSSWFSKSTQ